MKISLLQYSSKTRAYRHFRGDAVLLHEKGRVGGGRIAVTEGRSVTGLGEIACLVADAMRKHSLDDAKREDV